MGRCMLSMLFLLPLGDPKIWILLLFFFFLGFFRAEFSLSEEYSCLLGYLIVKLLKSIVLAKQGLGLDFLLCWASWRVS